MKHQVAVITDNIKFIVRMKQMVEPFNLELHEFSSPDMLMDHEEKVKSCKVVVLSAVNAQNQNETAGMVQTVKFLNPTAWIAVVVEKKVTTEEAQFIKKSGGEVVILEEDFLEKTKFEFILAKLIHSKWLPIKSADLIADHSVPFQLFHMMPLNQKMIPIVQVGQSLDKAKIEKFNSVGEFYIKHEDMDKYMKYVADFNDKSAAGLKRRCRSVYLNFVVTYKDLVMLLTDQSEGASFQAGKDLLNKLFALSGELITSLSASGEAWDVINNSSLEDTTPIDRVPAIAAYAGMMSLMAGIGNSDEVFQANTAIL